MPWVFRDEQLYCAISGKEIHDGDYVVVIPAFEIDPKDPESIFSDNIALRDEFEKWPLNDKIIAKSQKRWIQWYRDSTSYKILVDNENFLLMKSLIEDRVSLTFLRHVFGVATTGALWQKLCQQFLHSEKGHFQLSENERLTWSMEEPLSYVTLILDIENGSRDRIKVRLSEWLSLKDFLSLDSIMNP
jgi:hypothetical protein